MFLFFVTPHTFSFTIFYFVFVNHADFLTDHQDVRYTWDFFVDSVLCVVHLLWNWDSVVNITGLLIFVTLFTDCLSYRMLFSVFRVVRCYSLLVGYLFHQNFSELKLEIQFRVRVTLGFVSTIFSSAANTVVFTN